MAAIEYDPNRSAHLALLHYRDGEKRYIIAPHGLKVGDTLMSGPQADILPGNALPIRNIPVGTLVHNVELQPGPRRPAVPERRDARPSCWPRKGTGRRCGCPRARCGSCCMECMATIGQVGNLDHENVSVGKAGRRALAGLPADRARHRDEPGRPPDGRRRGQGQGQPSDDAVGEADQGLQDPARRKPSATRVIVTPPEEIGARRWDVRSRRGRTSTRSSDGRGSRS